MSITFKERLTKIAGAFNEMVQKFSENEPPPPPEPIPAKMSTEYKTADGQTVLSISALEVGGDVMVGETAAPDGEYTLEDKTIVQVAGGKIVELSSPIEDTMPEEMKTPAQMMSAIQKFAEPGANPDLQKMATILKACFEYSFGWQLRYEQEKATRDAAIATYKAGFAEHQKVNKDLMELVVELSEKSIVAPIEKQQKSYEQMTRREQVLFNRGKL